MLYILPMDIWYWFVIAPSRRVKTLKPRHPYIKINTYYKYEIIRQKIRTITITNPDFLLFRYTFLKCSFILTFSVIGILFRLKK